MPWLRKFVLACPFTLIWPLQAGAQHLVAVVEATCKASESLTLPAPDSPGSAAADCIATDLYDGVGKPADYKAARACALKVLADSTLNGQDRDASGSNFGVLSMVYANGLGVPRNDDLAIAYACKQGGAPAEIEGHVMILLDRRQQGAAAGRYDYCDDITSGLMQGFCAGRVSAKMEAGRNAKIDRLVSKLEGKARQRFQQLEKAHTAYVQAIGDKEVDMTGTGRGAFFHEATDVENARFLELLEQYMSARTKKMTQPNFRESDGKLNSRFRAVVSAKEFDQGTVTQDGIRQTQRRWLAYRDAFVALSGEPSDGYLAAVLTVDRANMLKRYLPEPD